MGTTEQQRVTQQLREKYGKTAYAEDHGEYKVVGFKRDGKRLVGVGDTWEEAMRKLEEKAK